MRANLDNFLLKTSEGLCVYTHEQYFIKNAVCLGTMSPLAWIWTVFSFVMLTKGEKDKSVYNYDEFLQAETET